MGFFTSRPKVVEYLRTCTRCGIERYLPPEFALEIAPLKMELLGTQMEAAGRDITLFGSGSKRTAAHTKLARLEERQQRVIDNARCPSCGSVSYTQTALTA